MVGAVRALLCAALLAAALSGAGARADAPGSLERSVCGWLAEPLGFFWLRAVAGSPRLARPEDVPGLERVRFRTKDDRLLGGYRLRAGVATGARPRGYVLVAQGNAMLAEHTVPLLRYFAAAGFDAYAYDFRGYGLSEGRSRLAAILSDYVEIVAHLNRQGYARTLLYGTSLGGIIILHAIDAGVSYHAAVVDSAPSRIERYGCPEELNPVRDVPADGSRLMVIVGGRDRVVPPRESRDLAERVAAAGGTVVRRDDFAHPFQDGDAATVMARWDLALGFFEDEIGGR